jgi:Glycosyl hydrolase family 26
VTLADEDMRSAAQSASRAGGESGARGGTIAVTFVILSALLIGPLFVIFSILRTGPFATGFLPYPAALVPSSGAYFGAFVGSRGEESPQEAVQRLESTIGRKLAIDHQYHEWDSPFPTPQETWAAARGMFPFLNWKAQRLNGETVPWSTIASGAEDAAIAARADAVKAFGSPVYLTFHHEPEDDLAAWGTPADYAAAFRHVVNIFRSRGVTNVAFVWTVMNWTFDPRSGRDPNAYYPGDGYVDIIGVDGYSWYPGKEGATWESFQQIFQTSNDFAVTHAKPWIVVETGAQEDPDQPGRKGQWFKDIVAAAKSWPLLKAVIYFDAIKEYDWNIDSSVSSTRGFVALGHHPYMSRTPPGVARPDLTLRNDIDLGPRGARVLAGQAGAGEPFSKVVTSSGATLTYDDAHALGLFSAKHDVTSDGNAYYQWTGLRSRWYGRLYLWLERPPISGVRLVRGSTNNVLRCALDILPDGTVRWVDQDNHPIVTTTHPLAFRRWVRIEWRVDHISGRVTVRLYNSAHSSVATEMVASARHRAIGPSAREIQYGRSGTQSFPYTFWTDRPALASTGYFAAASGE